MAEARTGREEVIEAARQLTEVRGRPCLVVDSPLEQGAVPSVCQALGDRVGEIDLVLRSPGGCACCAYVLGRELRRRFDRLAIFVPLAAKSSATLLVLVADELVLGDLGELGPLDAQFCDRQRADFPVERSRLEVFKALDQMQKHALAAFDETVRSVVEKSGMRGEDVCRIGLEFAVRICLPLYARIDPLILGQSARSIETGIAYAKRLLRRYRPNIWAHDGPRLVERLVRGYPDHGFVIDREELEELEIPARAPTPEEKPRVDRIATALSTRCDEGALIELIPAAATPREAADGTTRKAPDAEARAA